MFARSSLEFDFHVPYSGAFSLLPRHKFLNSSVHCGFFLLLSLLLAATGCSSSPLDAVAQQKPPTIEPAHPAQSPPPSQNPAGTVRPLGGNPLTSMFDNGTHQLAVLTTGSDSTTPASIAMFSDRQIAPRVITLPGPATALTSDQQGTAYLAAHGGYFRVDLSTGDIARVLVNEAPRTEFTAIARRADGKMVLGSANGTVYTLAAADHRGTAAVANQNTTFAHVDSLATQGNTAIVLDRAQTSVTTLDADGRAQQALRAGTGATTLATDPLGRVLVADTRGGQLLVYGVDPLILRQAYPVPDGPYGLAGSHRLAWVSQTASNTVIGYDLSTGIPVEKVRYPTVRQPNSLAFDDASDTLYVISSSGAGVQVIEHAAGAS